MSLLVPAIKCQFCGFALWHLTSNHIPFSRLWFLCILLLYTCREYKEELNRAKQSKREREESGKEGSCKVCLCVECGWSACAVRQTSSRSQPFQKDGSRSQLHSHAYATLIVESRYLARLYRYLHLASNYLMCS